MDNVIKVFKWLMSAGRKLVQFLWWAIRNWKIVGSALLFWWVGWQMGRGFAPSSTSTPRYAIALKKQKKFRKQLKYKVVISKEAKALAGIVTTKVQRKALKRRFSLVGEVQSQGGVLRAILAGRQGVIRKILVGASGQNVKKEQRLLELVHPELSAKQRLLQSAYQALQTAKPKAGESPEDFQKAKTQLSASWKKRRSVLLEMGYSKAELHRVERLQKPETSWWVTSPAAGVVKFVKVKIAQRVSESTALYVMNTQPTKIQVNLALHEYHIPWVRPGQVVFMSSLARPGYTWSGCVASLSKELSTKTRTLEARVQLQERAPAFQPGMRIFANVESAVSEFGLPKPSAKDSPCAKFRTPGKRSGGNVLPLVIPATAPLVMPRKAYVFVQIPKNKRPTFEIRKVQLGPRIGSFYVVNKGLKEGEAVVTHGAFKLESERQKYGLPSLLQ